MSAISTATLLAALAVLLVVTWHWATQYQRSSGLLDCLATHGNCDNQLSDFHDRYFGFLTVPTLVSFLPLLVGVFWGAPLVAREVEQGTHRLAWSQSVGRGRWIATKLGLYLLGSVLLGALVTVVFNWWSQPYTRLSGTGLPTSRIQPSLYQVLGTVPAGYMLVGFALGTAAGVLVRRTLPAIAVTLGGYLGLSFVLANWRGTRLLPPLRLVRPFGSPNPRAGLGDWIVADGSVDASGHAVTFRDIARICPPVKFTGRDNYTACASAHGFRSSDLYQPLSRFWPLQFVETGILVGIAVVLLGVAVWWTLRRSRLSGVANRRVPQ